MKICWDNLEGLRYSKKTGKWYKGNTTYIYKEKCGKCGEPFLTRSYIKNARIYCSVGCIRKGEHLTKKHKKILLKFNKGNHHTEETKKKIGKSNEAENGSNWKGGYRSNNIPFYDTYAPQLEWCEEVRRNKEDKNVLEVKCTYCGKWFIPTMISICNRIQSLNSLNKGEGRLYCSNGCKQACPIYGKMSKTLIRMDAIRVGRLSWLELNREVQPELRKMVLKRDKYKCVKCGSNGPLHCHHIYPVSIEFIESADIDNCMTLCIDCHKEAHQKDGCKYNQLRMEEC
jgi:hypothetical protein